MTQEVDFEEQAKQILAELAHLPIEVQREVLNLALFPPVKK